MHKNLPDRSLAALLKKVRTFAIIGASEKPERPSYGVMQFLLERGYRVVPVNPGLAGKEILGQRVYAHLADVPPPVDVADIFRAPEAAMAAVAMAIEEKERLGVSVVWMQLGVVNDEAAATASGAGLKVVMDRCPKIEIQRLGVPSRAAGKPVTKKRFTPGNSSIKKSPSKGQCAEPKNISLDASKARPAKAQKSTIRKQP